MSSGSPATMVGAKKESVAHWYPDMVHPIEKDHQIMHTVVGGVHHHKTEKHTLYQMEPILSSLLRSVYEGYGDCKGNFLMDAEAFVLVLLQLGMDSAVRSPCAFYLALFNVLRLENSWRYENVQISETWRQMEASRLASWNKGCMEQGFEYCVDPKGHCHQKPSVSMLVGGSDRLLCVGCMPVIRHLLGPAVLMDLKKLNRVSFQTESPFNIHPDVIAYILRHFNLPKLSSYFPDAAWRIKLAAWAGAARLLRQEIQNLCTDTVDKGQLKFGDDRAVHHSDEALVLAADRISLSDVSLRDAVAGGIPWLVESRLRLHAAEGTLECSVQRSVRGVQLFVQPWVMLVLLPSKRSVLMSSLLERFVTSPAYHTECLIVAAMLDKVEPFSVLLSHQYKTEGNNKFPCSSVDSDSLLKVVAGNGSTSVLAFLSKFDDLLTAQRYLLMAEAATTAESVEMLRLLLPHVEGIHANISFLNLVLQRGSSEILNMLASFQGDHSLLMAERAVLDGHVGAFEELLPKVAGNINTPCPVSRLPIWKLALLATYKLQMPEFQVILRDSGITPPGNEPFALEAGDLDFPRKRSRDDDE